MDKIFTTLAIPNRHQVIAIVPFFTRSYDHWCHTNDTGIKNLKQMYRLPYHSGEIAPAGRDYER